MKVQTQSRPSSAFTLIELLVVIAIIAVLASLIFPVMGAVNRAKIRNRSQSELSMLQTGIATYKTRFGQYPPDNVLNKNQNPLYYELAGTILKQGTYTTLDGSS